MERARLTTGKRVWKALAVLVCGWSATGIAAAQSRILNSFETPDELRMVQASNARASVTTQGMTDGAQALKIDLLPSAWPSVKLVPPSPWNFQGFGEMAVDITNPTAEALRVYLRADDDPRADGWNYCQQGSDTIEPGATVTLSFPLRDPSAYGMAALPSWPGSRLLFTSGAAPLQQSHVVAINLFLRSPATVTTLIVDNIRLRPPYPLTGIVDAFGQFTGADWPGKLTSADQFATRRAAEEADLAAHPSLPDRDRFGGWAQGPKLNATGFFRTERVKGKWWLVTPEGDLFFSTGIDSISLWEHTLTTGREYMFTWLPGPTDPLAQHFTTVTGVQGLAPGKQGQAYSFQSANLGRKYGADYLNAWKETALARLPSWGFNTIGTADLLFYGSGRLPYVVEAKIAGNYNVLTPAAGWGPPVPDAYDPRFVTSAANTLRAASSRAGGPPGPNLIANPEFTGNAAGWVHGDSNGARSTLSPIPDGTPGIRWTATQTGTQSYSLQLYVAGLNLVEGAPYQLQFRARADASRTIVAAVGLDGTPDYRAFLSVRPQLSTTWQSFSYSFVAAGTNANHVRMIFDAQNQIGVFDLADVKLQKVPLVKDDPWCLGYFVDEEPNWGGTSSDATRYGLALAALAQNTSASPVKQELLREIQAKYPAISQLNAAWGTGFADWNAVQAPTGTLNAAAKADMGAFITSLARQYFRIVRDQLKSADPNHLYLGCRFGIWSPEIVAVSAELCDVVSFDPYVPRLDDTWSFLNNSPTPCIVGGYSFGTRDRGMFYAGLVEAPNVRARAQMYQDYVRSVLDHPAFVGCHWFSYGDQPLTGRDLGLAGENGNYGFLSITDTPYPEMVAGARAVNQEIYPRRYGN